MTQVFGNAPLQSVAHHLGGDGDRRLGIDTARCICLQADSPHDLRKIACHDATAEQLLRRDLVSDVRSVIARANLKPRCFRLELTESLVMDNPEQAAHVLGKLKRLGIGLSLDDFGTGYSSLSYLTRFPFDTIKIDKSFVDDATPKRAVLLRSMVHMAHELGLSVVAEGIADQSDALELRQMGCEYVQSFMFGAPVAGDAVVKMLKEQFAAAPA